MLETILTEQPLKKQMVLYLLGQALMRQAMDHITNFKVVHLGQELLILN